MLFIEAYVKDEVLKDPDISLLESSFEYLDCLLENADNSEILNEANGNFGRMLIKVKMLILKASQNILVCAIKMKEKLRKYLNKLLVNKKTVKADNPDYVNSKDVDDFITGKYTSDGKGGVIDIKNTIRITIPIPSALYHSINDITNLLADPNTLHSGLIRNFLSKFDNTEYLKKRSSMINVKDLDELLDGMKKISKDIHLTAKSLFSSLESSKEQTLNGYFSREGTEKTINELLKLSLFITKCMMSMLSNFDQEADLT